MAEVTAQESIEAENHYLDFFDRSEKYKDRINNLVANRKLRLIIDLNDLRQDPNNRVNKKLLENSFVELSAIQKVLKRYITNVNPEYGKSREEFYVGFEGSFGTRQLTCRSLTSQYLGNMVCVEGIVTKVISNKLKIAHSVHYCPETEKYLDRHYSHLTSNQAFQSNGAYPTRDEEGHILETEYGLSYYTDCQTMLIQEMPESTPAGLMPRSVEVVVANDLVGCFKAGDRVYVAGQFRSLPNKKNGFTNAMFRSVLIANNICLISQINATQVENQDFRMIRSVGKKSNVFDLLVRSIAPSIYGHEYIKRALLCQLLGGVERKLDNGTRIRGDINIMLIGDPSVAKSQFLRYVLQVAKGRSVATTGRGSTGVGLTAAVSTDPETGGKILEAGAMVLADRGIICIDEFDKMSDVDRTAIHEVMEQGRISIAKAGIQAKLNARCSVLAAANPVYGFYDQYKSPMDNIGLQDSLLSRFDLLFVILDQCDEENDRSIANFVVNMHCARNPGEEEGQPLPLEHLNTVDFVKSSAADASTLNSQAIYEESENSKKNKNGQVLTKQFLEKYLEVAQQLKPQLTVEAAEVIANKYNELRDQDFQISNNASDSNKCRTQPVTARTHETLIRLATAHAKARLGKKVTVNDAEAAADLVSYALFKEVLQKKRRARVNQDSGDEEQTDDELDLDNLNDVNIKKRKTEKPTQPDSMDVDDSTPVTSTPSTSIPTTITASAIAPNADQITLINRMLRQAFDERHETNLSIVECCQYVCAKEPSVNAGQVKFCMDKLHNENLLMVTEDQVYLL